MTDSKNADVILTNGKFYTVDKNKSWAEAAAIKGNTIICTGSESAVMEYKGRNTTIINLGGRMVLPGFVDAHMHPLMSADVYENQIKLFESPDREDMLKVIKEFAEEHPRHEVIRGAGFPRSAFDETGPRKEWLDTLVPDRPVYIVSGDGHSAWVNSAALKLAGITAKTPQPEKGHIMHDPASGEPSGLLQENGAMKLVAELLPPISKDRYKDDISAIEKYFSHTGITTVFDAKVTMDDENYWMAYKEMAEEGRLGWRYRGGWYLDPAKDLSREIDKGVGLSKIVNTTEFFQVNAFKFFLDEVAEEKTSLMLEPFQGEKEYRGFRNFEDKQLLDAFVRLDEQGFQIHCHQIGDGAARYGLEALEKLQQINGIKDRRPSFAHCQWVSDQDKKRMADLDVTSIISAYWMATDDYYWDLYRPYLGANRVNNMYPVKSLFNLGVNMAVHSDFFVSEPDPLYAIYGGITRNIPERIFREKYEQDNRYRRVTEPRSDYSQGEIGPLPPMSERASLEDMIYAFTMGGARSLFMENEIGSIEAGKKADLVILEKNLFEVDVEEIPDVAIDMVFFDGKQKYLREGLDSL